jgi:predicted enzyme related to lactoylglutathione lyase
MTEAHGKFVWNELNTRDIEGAKRFLSTTLGWTFESMPIPDDRTTRKLTDINAGCVACH